MPRKPHNQLSPKDELILRIITESIEHKNTPPTVREIQQKAAISSPSVVHAHLKRLERLGYIERTRSADGKRMARNIRLKKQPHNVAARDEADVGRLAEFAAQRRGGHPAPRPGARQPAPLASLPLAGRIVASQPIPSFPEAFAPDETVEIPVSLLPRDTSRLYALEVSGNSMIDALIGDGDLVVLQETKEAANGEMVAVWLKDTNESTLKRFYGEYQEGRLVGITLKPANPTMQPIKVSNPAAVEIMGKVVLVIRRTDGTIRKPRPKAA